MNTKINQMNANLVSKLNCSMSEIDKKVSKFSNAIAIAKSDEDLNRILVFREATYSECLPDVNYKTLEQVDFHSILFYSEDGEGNIESSCRLVLDSDVGFAEDYVYQEHIQGYRDQGMLIAEWGRCIVSPRSKVRAVDYAYLVESLAQELGIQHVVIFNRKCDVSRMLETLSNTEVMVETDITLGGSHTFTAMLWSFPQNNREGATIYRPNVWSDYAKSFMTVTSSFQSELLREAANHLSGAVVDCGSGCAKMAPYLRYRADVTSYTAIDACPDMCQYGLEVLERVSRANFSIVESFIQDYVADKQFDSVVSINSFYTWPEPQAVLRHIHSLLKCNGKFVLATINSSINMDLLVREAEPDLIMHPDAEKFKEMNQQLASNGEANLMPIDELIQEVRQAGFEVLEGHDRFYLGGLSFLVLTRT